MLFSTKSIYIHITFHSLKTAKLAEKTIILGIFMGAMTDKLASVLIANAASILLYGYCQCWDYLDKNVYYLYLI
jgi:hypothetical protein